MRSKSVKKVEYGYVKGRRVNMREQEPYLIKPTAKCRTQVNRELRKFLNSDRDYMVIRFDGDIVPHTIFKGIINIKTCSNVWAQYVIALFDNWPDLISKRLKNYDYVRVGDAVMKNEVLGNNYSMQEFIPKGYKINTVKAEV